MNTSKPICAITTCVRYSSNSFCDHHELALSNLNESYLSWKKAFGRLSKPNYYKKIISSEEIPVGKWVREVAEYLLKSNNIKK